MCIRDSSEVTSCRLFDRLRPEQTILGLILADGDDDDERNVSEIRVIVIARLPLSCIYSLNNYYPILVNE